jgi:hypothetical protein
VSVRTAACRLPLPPLPPLPLLLLLLLAYVHRHHCQSQRLIHNDDRCWNL